MEAVRPVEREIWREEDSRPPIHHPKPREDWTGGKGPRPVVFRWELKRLWEHASSLLDHPLHDYYSEPYNYGPFRFRTFLQFPKISSRNSRSVRDARALRSILVYLKVLDPPKSKEASLTVTFAFAITNPKDPSKSKIFNYTHSFKGKKEWTAGLPKEKALSFRLLQGMGFFHNGSLMIETHISHVTPKGFSCAPNSVFVYSPAYLQLESWHDCDEDVKKGVKGLSTKNNTLLILSETTLMTENAIGQELWLASHDQNNIPGGQRVRVKNGRERGKKKKNVWEQGTIDLNGFAGSIRWCRAPTKESVVSIVKYMKEYSDSTQIWVLTERKNGTRRPDNMLTPMERERFFGPCWMNRERWFYCSKCKQHCRRPLWVFLRSERAEDYKGIGTLILLKVFDPSKRKMFYVGSGIFKSTSTVEDLWPRLQHLAKIPANTELKVYEEENASLGKLRLLRPKDTLLESGLCHGDILCFHPRFSVRTPYGNAELLGRFSGNMVTLSLQWGAIVSIQVSKTSLNPHGIYSDFASREALRESYRAVTQGKGKERKRGATATTVAGKKRVRDVSDKLFEGINLDDVDFEDAARSDMVEEGVAASKKLELHIERLLEAEQFAVVANDAEELKRLQIELEEARQLRIQVENLSEKSKQRLDALVYQKTKVLGEREEYLHLDGLDETNLDFLQYGYFKRIAPTPSNEDDNDTSTTPVGSGKDTKSTAKKPEEEIPLWEHSYTQYRLFYHKQTRHWIIGVDAVQHGAGELCVANPDMEFPTRRSAAWHKADEISKRWAPSLAICLRPGKRQALCAEAREYLAWGTSNKTQITSATAFLNCLGGCQGKICSYFGGPCTFGPWCTAAVRGLGRGAWAAEYEGGGAAGGMWTSKHRGGSQREQFEVRVVDSTKPQGYPKSEVWFRVTPMVPLRRVFEVYSQRMLCELPKTQFSIRGLEVSWNSVQTIGDAGLGQSDSIEAVPYFTSHPGRITVSGRRGSSSGINGVYLYHSMHQGRPAYKKSGSDFAIRFYAPKSRWYIDPLGLRDVDGCYAYNSTALHPGLCQDIWHVWDGPRNEWVADSLVRVRASAPPGNMPLPEDPYKEPYAAHKSPGAGTAGRDSKGGEGRKQSHHKVKSLREIVQIKDDDLRWRREARSQMNLIALSSALESSLRKLEGEINGGKEEMEEYTEINSQGTDTLVMTPTSLFPKDLHSVHERLLRLTAVLNDGLPFEEVIDSCSKRKVGYWEKELQRCREMEKEAIDEWKESLTKGVKLDKAELEQMRRGRAEIKGHEREANRHLDDAKDWQIAQSTRIDLIIKDTEKLSRFWQHEAREIKATTSKSSKGNGTSSKGSGALTAQSASSINPNSNSNISANNNNTSSKLGASSSSVSPNQLCPKGHSLKEIRTMDNEFTCDVCRKDMKVNSLMHGCRECNWDSCDACYTAGFPATIGPDAKGKGALERGRRGQGEATAATGKKSSKRKSSKSKTKPMAKPLAKPLDPIGGSNTIHNTTNSIASSHSGTGSNSRQSRTATGDKETASTGSTRSDDATTASYKENDKKDAPQKTSKNSVANNKASSSKRAIQEKVVEETPSGWKCQICKRDASSGEEMTILECRKGHKSLLHSSCLVRHVHDSARSAGQLKRVRAASRTSKLWRQYQKCLREECDTSCVIDQKKTRPHPPKNTTTSSRPQSGSKSGNAKSSKSGTGGETKDTSNKPAKPSDGDWEEVGRGRRGRRGTSSKNKSVDAIRKSNSASQTPKSSRRPSASPSKLASNLSETKSSTSNPSQVSTSDLPTDPLQSSASAETTANPSSAIAKSSSGTAKSNAGIARNSTVTAKNSAPMAKNSVAGSGNKEDPEAAASSPKGEGDKESVPPALGDEKGGIKGSDKKSAEGLVGSSLLAELNNDTDQGTKLSASQKRRARRRKQRQIMEEKQETEASTNTSTSSTPNPVSVPTPRDNPTASTSPDTAAIIAPNDIEPSHTMLATSNPNPNPAISSLPIPAVSRRVEDMHISGGGKSDESTGVGVARSQAAEERPPPLLPSTAYENGQRGNNPNPSFTWGGRTRNPGGFLWGGAGGSKINPYVGGSSATGTRQNRPTPTVKGAPGPLGVGWGDNIFTPPISAQTIIPEGSQLRADAAEWTPRGNVVNSRPLLPYPSLHNPPAQLPHLGQSPRGMRPKNGPPPQKHTDAHFQVIPLEGVAYRSHPDLRSRVPQLKGPRGGEIVRAALVHDRWVQLPNGYWLPRVVDGLKVLVRVDVNISEDADVKLMPHPGTAALKARAAASAGAGKSAIDIPTSQGIAVASSAATVPFSPRSADELGISPPKLGTGLTRKGTKMTSLTRTQSDTGVLTRRPDRLPGPSLSTSAHPANRLNPSSRTASALTERAQQPINSTPAPAAARSVKQRMLDVEAKLEQLMQSVKRKRAAMQPMMPRLESKRKPLLRNSRPNPVAKEVVGGHSKSGGDSAGSGGGAGAGEEDGGGAELVDRLERAIAILSEIDERGSENFSPSPTPSPGAAAAAAAAGLRDGGPSSTTDAIRAELGRVRGERDAYRREIEDVRRERDELRGEQMATQLSLKSALSLVNITSASNKQLMEQVKDLQAKLKIAHRPTPPSLDGIKASGARRTSLLLGEVSTSTTNGTDVSLPASSIALSGVDIASLSLERNASDSVDDESRVVEAFFGSIASSEGNFPPRQLAQSRLQRLGATGGNPSGGLDRGLGRGLGSGLFGGRMSGSSLLKSVLNPEREGKARQSA